MKEEAKSPRLYDSRIVTRNIRKGLLTRKDYDKFLQALPDVSDKVAPPESSAPPPASAEGGAPPVPVPTPIIAHPPAPGSPELRIDSDDDLDDDEDEDLEDEEIEDPKLASEEANKDASKESDKEGGGQPPPA